jgi:hypothetical protein
MLQCKILHYIKSALLKSTDLNTAQVKKNGKQKQYEYKKEWHHSLMQMQDSSAQFPMLRS